MKRVMNNLKDEFLDDMARMHKQIADITLVDGSKISGEDLRLEHHKYAKGGRITSLDLLEAREFFGEDDWKKLSKQDRINSAKYLKRTGKIGYKKGGKIKPSNEPMESQEFYSAMQYDKGGDVLMEIDTHKAVKHGDKIKIYRKELQFDSNYDVIGEKLIYLYSIPIENEDDLLPIFEDFEETNRYLIDEANREMMANGGMMLNITHYDVTITAEPKKDNKNWANFVTFDTRIQTKDKQEAIRKAKLEFYAMYPNEKIMKIDAEPDTSAYIPNMPTDAFADGGMMADGGETEELYKVVGKKNGQLVDISELPMSKDDAYKFIKKQGVENYYTNVDVIRYRGNKPRHKMADGGDISDKEVAESNVEMLQSNIKSIKHHAEELENAVKGKAEIEGWVLAKADRAATAMSDITHYLDGRKMGMGGMVAGYYYKDKDGEKLRYIGPDSASPEKGIFKAGEKYVHKSYDEFEEEPKENKLFGWFGNGGYMPKGTNRKLTLTEKAEEMVGRSTWNDLDASTKEGVISDLIEDGALAVTMEDGGIINASDWDKASTDEKIYALKKAGYSNNMSSEMCLLPYEQVPMWVREDFRRGAIVIGDYHIHKNRLSSPVPLNLGIYLVFNGNEEVVHSANTLEEAKEWATEEARLDKEESQDYELVSDCCGAPQGHLSDICPACMEHCDWEKEYYAEGGVTQAIKFKVIYKIKDLEPKEKIFDDAEKAEFFLETIKEDDDIESANLVEVKPEKKAVEKKTNLFAAAKPAAKTSGKKTIEDVVVTGIADEIARYDALKAIIKNAETEKDQIGDRLKEVGVDKFLELYELRRRNPDTFNLSDEDKNIMFIVMDKYKKVEPEKVAMLESYPGLLETVTTYKFNTQLLDKTGEIVSRLIMESDELTDEEKENLIIAETKVGIKSGTIDRLMDYENPAQIFAIIEPVLALK
jgi:hypothetical protein